MKRRTRETKADITPNLTSLIDVTFLLIIFFVLVTRITEDEHVELDLPSPKSPATLPPGAEKQVVVNAVPTADGSVREYRVGNHGFASDAAGLEAMTSHLAALYSAHREMRVNLRADKAAHYESIEPALAAIGTAARQVGQVPRVNLVISREE